MCPRAVAQNPRSRVSFCVVHKFVSSSQVFHCALRDRLLDACHTESQRGSTRSYQPNQLTDQLTEHRDIRFNQASFRVLSHLLGDLYHWTSRAHTSPVRQWSLPRVYLWPQCTRLSVAHVPCTKRLLSTGITIFLEPIGSYEVTIITKPMVQMIFLNINDFLINLRNIQNLCIC